MEKPVKQAGPEADGSRFVLAIDLGSGGPKAAVVSENGRIAAHAADKVATHLLPGGGAEQDAGDWWRGVRNTARKAIHDSGVPADRIVAVSCTSQWAVVVPIDQHGEPLMRAVHWLDTRGGPYNQAVTRGFPTVQGYGLLKLLKWIRLTGGAPTLSGVDSLGHVLFIKHERPEVYRRTYKFLEPMDYLNLRLTGRCVATQATMAPFMVVDNRAWSSLEYSPELLRLAGVERDKLPDLIPNDGEVGTLTPAVAQELGLHPSTRVIAGINDTNASAIGAGAVRDFDGIVYIGTSAVLTCHIPFKKTDVLHMMASLPSPLKDKYLLMAEQGTGGKNLDFYLRNIVYAEDDFGTGPLPDDAYLRADRAAAAVPAGSGDVLFLPWLNGTLAPEENPRARGGFFNLSLSSTRAQMTRAVLEGIAFNNRWTVGPAEKFVGRKFQEFRFAGGGALSDLWAQIHADVLGVPIHRVVDPYQTTVRGAAFFALYKLGLRTLDELRDRVGIERVFEPQAANRPTYDRLYAQFREIYRRNKKVFAALNGAGGGGSPSPRHE